MNAMFIKKVLLYGIIIAIGLEYNTLRSCIRINQGYLIVANFSASMDVFTEISGIAIGDAIANFESALVFNPHSEQGYFALAMARYLIGEYTQAAEGFWLAQKYGSDRRAISLLYLGLTLEAQDKHAEAVSFWREATNTAMYFRNQAELAKSQEERLWFAKSAVEVDPTLVGANYLLGLGYVRQREVVHAEDAFLREITLFRERDVPCTGEWRRWTGKTFMELGYLYSSQSLFEKAQYMFENGLHCGQPDAISAIAWMLHKQGYSDLALQVLRDHMEKSSDYWQNFAVYGDILTSQGDVFEGIVYYYRAVSIAPERLDLRIRLADAYARLGMCDEARDALQNRLEQPTDSQGLKSIWESCP